MMKIFLNGSEYACPPGLSVTSLLDQAGYAERKVAVEINREIVPRSQHPTRIIQLGDRIEIVHAIGGG